MNVDKIKKEIEDCLNMFIDYDIGKYELFYSKSLSIVSQLLPDRQNDFINFYK